MRHYDNTVAGLLLSSLFLSPFPPLRRNYYFHPPPVIFCAADRLFLPFLRKTHAAAAFIFFVLLHLERPRRPFCYLNIYAPLRPVETSPPTLPFPLPWLFPSRPPLGPACGTTAAPSFGFFPSFFVYVFSINPASPFKLREVNSPFFFFTCAPAPLWIVLIASFFLSLFFGSTLIEVFQSPKLWSSSPPAAAPVVLQSSIASPFRNKPAFFLVLPALWPKSPPPPFPRRNSILPRLRYLCNIAIFPSFPGTIGASAPTPLFAFFSDNPPLTSWLSQTGSALRPLLPSPL